ncbi:hypothetical protein [Calothrix sp. UHCC 0171]|uniref:hypothetical protein n=1 Tax=Calothrix sp. UHCC 0171 TaxID=3110245 RepID=UPI002B21A02F|nr:hypothetical protein [Calothrix sp. UHCC 0171]MEA5569697.1 hypothetical protein [Calothrix sp. UHCC 0171]
MTSFQIREKITGEMGRWGDGEMGRRGDGETGRWGDGFSIFVPASPRPRRIPSSQHPRRVPTHRVPIHRTSS